MIPEVFLNPTAAQNEDVCLKTATFCRFMIPGLFPWSLVTILMKVCRIFLSNAILASYTAHRKPLPILICSVLKGVFCVVILQ